MAQKRRFTVTMDEQDYVQLLELASKQSPPLPMTYVVNYAIKRFLERTGKLGRGPVLGNPGHLESRNG